jgi:hypothetical protein
MPVTINWATKIITVPTSFMTLVSGTPGVGDSQPDPALYELDVNALRLALKDIEDSDGIPFPDTHRHNGVVTISGVSYARTFEVINGYTVLFDTSTYDHYTVRCAGANHNIADVRRPNTVSLIIGNSAGLIAVGTSLSATEQTKLDEIWKDLGLDPASPKTITENTVGTDYTEAVGAGIVKNVTKSGSLTTIDRT